MDWQRREKAERNVTTPPPLCFPPLQHTVPCFITYNLRITSHTPPSNKILSASYRIPIPSRTIIAHEACNSKISILLPLLGLLGGGLPLFQKMDSDCPFRTPSEHDIPLFGSILWYSFIYKSNMVHSLVRCSDILKRFFFPLLASTACPSLLLLNASKASIALSMDD